VCCRAGYTCLWALAAGGRLGVGSDPRYNKTRCFDPFPFPTPTELQQSRICALAESLDAHRKRQQAQHPDLTTTGMYNVLEKLRSGAKLSATEQKIREHGLVSVLKQIHDDIDAAVSDAYGWPYDLSDEQILERLVALNAERAAEERRGLVRWLRPEFQNLSGARDAAQTEIAGTEVGETAAVAAPAKAIKWPAKLPAQIALVRNLVTQGRRIVVHRRSREPIQRRSPRHRRVRTRQPRRARITRRVWHEWNPALEGPRARCGVT